MSKLFVCQVCKREYKRNPAVVKKDGLAGKEYMKCPNDGGIAYPKPKAKPKKETPVKPKPKAKTVTKEDKK